MRGGLATGGRHPRRVIFCLGDTSVGLRLRTPGRLQPFYLPADKEDQIRLCLETKLQIDKTSHLLMLHCTLKQKQPALRP